MKSYTEQKERELASTKQSWERKMQSDLENQRHEQLRTFIKEMSGVL